jgi:hypothetical protein
MLFTSTSWTKGLGMSSAFAGQIQINARTAVANP